VTTKSSSAWPANTDLFFPTGRGQVLLTLQSMLIQVVTQDTIKHLRASLVFKNAVVYRLGCFPGIPGRIVVGEEENYSYSLAKRPLCMSTFPQCLLDALTLRAGSGPAYSATYVSTLAGLHLYTPLQAGANPISSECFLCLGCASAFVRMSAVCSGSRQLWTSMVFSSTRSLIQCHLMSMCLDCL
jgi:hypothetical protein